MNNRAVYIQRAVIPRAVVHKPIADLDAASAYDSGVLRRDYSFLEAGGSYQDLPGRPSWIQSLNGFVQKRVQGIVYDSRDFFAALARDHVASEDIRIEAWNGHHCEDLTVSWIHRDCRAGIALRIKLIF